MNLDTRFYVAIVNSDGTHVSNMSQIDKPTMYELRAFVMATGDFMDSKQLRLRRVSELYSEGECHLKTYAIYIYGERMPQKLTVDERANDIAYSQQFGALAPEESDEEVEAYYERWNQLAPRRCVE